MKLLTSKEGKMSSYGCLNNFFGAVNGSENWTPDQPSAICTSITAIGLLNNKKERWTKCVGTDIENTDFEYDSGNLKVEVNADVHVQHV